MNNKEFIDALSKELGVTQKESAALAECVIAVMTDELQKDNSINIPDFGTFEVKKKMERISVIPSTQQRVLVPPKLVPSFRPSSALKEKVK